MARDELVGKVADELEIRNLLARLSMGTDEATPEDYGALFAEDAVWSMATVPGAVRTFPPLHGRATIVAAVKERRANGIGGPGSHSRHALFQSVVEVDGDTAQARSYTAFFVELDRAPVTQLFAIYQDSFVRTAEGWKLKSRRIEPG